MRLFTSLVVLLVAAGIGESWCSPSPVQPSTKPLHLGQLPMQYGNTSRGAVCKCWFSKEDARRDHYQNQHIRSIDEGNVGNLCSCHGNMRFKRFFFTRRVTSGVHSKNFMLRAPRGQKFIAKCVGNSVMDIHHELAMHRRLQDMQYIRRAYGTVRLRSSPKRVRHCLALAWADYEFSELFKRLKRECTMYQSLLLYQACTALQSLHDRNITHGDLNSRQFLVKIDLHTKRLESWLIDFTTAAPAEGRQLQYQSEKDVRQFASFYGKNLKFAWPKDSNGKQVPPGQLLKALIEEHKEKAWKVPPFSEECLKPVIPKNKRRLHGAPETWHETLIRKWNKMRKDGIAAVFGS